MYIKKFEEDKFKILLGRALLWFRWLKTRHCPHQNWPHLALYLQGSDDYKQVTPWQHETMRDLLWESIWEIRMQEVASARPITCQPNIDALNEHSLREDRGINRLIWTIEKQSWETDCRICCLTNQACQSVRVKCERVSVSLCKNRLPPVANTRLLLDILKHTRMWCWYSSKVITRSFPIHLKVANHDIGHM